MITPFQREGVACGFTLIELMVTLAVAAILTMVAVPSFRHVLVSTHLSNLNNDLAHDLQYARTEAVSRQVPVAVAASAGGWQSGWTVEAAPATSTAVVLLRHPAVSAQYAVAANPVGDVTYVPQGTLTTGAAGACFTVSAASGENNQVRFLQVTPSGSLQQTTGGTPPVDPDCTAP